MKLRVWTVATLFGSSLLHGQGDLPRHEPGESLDFEPKLMLDGPRADVAPDSSPAASPEERVKQLEATLLIARQRAGDSEQLFKDGILARVEVEARGLRVTRVEKDLADARVAVAAAQADAMKKTFDNHGATKAELDAANAALKTARDAAAAATAELKAGELEAARVDLGRKRKLYAEGVGSKREVQLAEDRLVLLTGTAPH